MSNWPVEKAERIVAGIGRRNAIDVRVGSRLEPLLPGSRDGSALARRLRRIRGRCQPASDVESAAGATGQETFGDELLAGDHDRVARDAELFRQLARRRQARTRLENAQVNRLDQLLPDLRLQTQLAVRLDVEQRFGFGHDDQYRQARMLAVRHAAPASLQPDARYVELARGWRLQREQHHVGDGAHVHATPRRRRGHGFERDAYRRARGARYYDRLVEAVCIRPVVRRVQDPQHELRWLRRRVGDVEHEHVVLAPVWIRLEHLQPGRGPRLEREPHGIRVTRTSVGRRQLDVRHTGVVRAGEQAVGERARRHQHRKRRVACGIGASALQRLPRQQRECAQRDGDYEARACISQRCAVAPVRQPALDEPGAGQAQGRSCGVVHRIHGRNAAAGHRVLQQFRQDPERDRGQERVSILRRGADRPAVRRHSHEQQDDGDACEDRAVPGVLHDALPQRGTRQRKEEDRAQQQPNQHHSCEKWQARQDRQCVRSVVRQAQDYVRPPAPATG